MQQAKDAGVWVFGGGLNDSVPAMMVDADGRATAGTYPETVRLDGGFTVLVLPTDQAALEWAARIAAACRCAQEVRAFHYDPES